MKPVDIAKSVLEDGWNRVDVAKVRPLPAPGFPLHGGDASHLTDAGQFETIVSEWHQAFPTPGSTITANVKRLIPEPGLRVGYGFPGL